MEVFGATAPCKLRYCDWIENAISADSITATFASNDIVITNNTAGLNYDVEVTAGSTNSASKGELTITLAGALMYPRLAGKCRVLFTPDGGTTNYVFGLREDALAGVTRITLTGT